MRLVMIRHAETPSNVAGVIDSRIPGPVLTQHGKHQAQEVVARLAGEQPDRICVSTQIRTQLTAHPFAVARGLTPLIHPGLCEITSGELESRGDSAAISIYLEVAYSWLCGELDRRIPGGENGVEFFRRFDAAIATATRRAESVVVFGHGLALRTWAGRRALNVEPEFAAANDLDNTELVVLEKTVSGWVVLQWRNEVLNNDSLFA